MSEKVAKERLICKGMLDGQKTEYCRYVYWYVCTSVCLSAGQIELYTHIPVMRQFVDHLRSLNFYICGVFLIDAQFLIDASKFASGVLSALSTMVNLEVGCFCLLTVVWLLILSRQFIIIACCSIDFSRICSFDSVCLKTVVLCTQYTPF